MTSATEAAQCSCSWTKVTFLLQQLNVDLSFELLQLSHQFTHLHVCVVYICHGSVCTQKKKTTTYIFHKYADCRHNCIIINILPSLIRSHHFLNPATLISDNSAVSVLTSILKQPVPSLPLLSTLNLTTATLSTTIFLNLKQTASSRFRTVLHVLRPLSRRRQPPRRIFRHAPRRRRIFLWLSRIPAEFFKRSSQPNIFRCKFGANIQRIVQTKQITLKVHI